MRSLALTGLLLISGLACATEVRLALYEAQSNQTSFHSLDVASGEVSSAQSAGTVELGTLEAYRVRNEHVEDVQSGQSIAEATEILCQATSGGVDLIVVRQEYNSLSSPVRWLSAFSGHPVQVSKIVWLLVREGKVVHIIELMRKPASYHWKAKLSEGPWSNP